MAARSDTGGGKSTAPDIPAHQGSPIITMGVGQASAGPVFPASQPGPTMGRGNAPKSGKINARYPVRNVTFYQIARSDLRSLGAAQLATTISAGIGTWALTSYLDISRDIANQGSKAPAWLIDVSNVAFAAWLIFWGLAIVAFGWQGWEIRRIKVEHGEPSWLERIKAYFR